MQIGSVPSDYATSVSGAQGAAPPTPLAVAQQKDKDGDSDNSATRGADNASGRQVNVVA